MSSKLRSRNARAVLSISNAECELSRPKPLTPRAGTSMPAKSLMRCTFSGVRSDWRSTGGSDTQGRGLEMALDRVAAASARNGKGGTTGRTGCSLFVSIRSSMNKFLCEQEGVAFISDTQAPTTRRSPLNKTVGVTFISDPQAPTTWFLSVSNRSSMSKCL